MKMRISRRTVSGLLAAAALLAGGLARPQPSQPVPPAVEALAAKIAGELAQHCPLADANDAAAFDSCRAMLYGDSTLRAHLPPVLLWGRQSANPQATLRQTNLTQFAPDVWIALYAPLFMFNGRYQVEWVPAEKQFAVRLEAAFRNRLAPGQFPYPFWHDDSKWGTYQNANGFLLWVHPATLKVQVAQLTDRAQNALLQAVTPVQQAKFDGKWLWTDAAGRTQPAVTLFDGLYRAENPYLRDLDRQYRDLALQMRESQCTSCHVPNNPDKMSRLVLLSTPAHAAGEIDRLIKSVKEDRMPMDEYRNSYALSPEDKKWLLESAETFRGTVQAARAWEAQATRAESRLPAPWQPVATGQRKEVSQ
ncbi:hypothetical protein LZ009_12780 [Ramlibacter sp. XY19]|uniref:hypothetical protein n=1 Tax=Ramlibacter paludis TaxID=2908000 RepID=UPI0023DC03C1|nr:hypothetical protein [Ramlibacter paludis]MCG2593654.1 hypothetical protein [Ramlibacter paludis]